MVWTPFTRADHARTGLRYASDTTSAEWLLIAPFMPSQPSIGRKRSTRLRDVVDAIFYLLQSGCQWSMLPKDFPPKSTVCEWRCTSISNASSTMAHGHASTMLFIASPENWRDAKKARPTQLSTARAQKPARTRVKWLDLMLERRSKAASATFWSTHLA